MLSPKKTKYRKQQKGRMKGNATRGQNVAFGSFGMKAMDALSRRLKATPSVD